MVVKTTMDEEERCRDALGRENKRSRNYLNLTTPFWSALRQRANNMFDVTKGGNRTWVTPCILPLTTVQSLLRARNSAFRNNNKTQHRSARAELRRGNKETEKAYKNNVEDYLSNNNPRQVRHGLKHLTNYKDNTSTNCQH